MIKEITVELNGVPTLNIYEDTEVAQLLQDYSDDDEFTLSQINIVTDDGTLEVKAYDKWFDYDDLEELLTKLYELYEKDVSELYYELPDGDRENFRVDAPRRRVLQHLFRGKPDRSYPYSIIRRRPLE